MAENTATPATYDDDRVASATVGTPVSRISWGGILAGTACGIALYALLGIIGISIGFAVVDPAQDQDPLGGIATSAGVWWLISSLIAFFVGGMIAARFAGIPRSTSGILHGLTVWAIGSLAMLMLAATTVGSVVSGAAGALAGLVTDSSRQINVQVQNPALRQQNRRLIEALRTQPSGGQSGGNASANNAGSNQAANSGGGTGQPLVQSGLTLAAYLMSSDREELSNYLTQTMTGIRQDAREFLRPVLNRSEQQRAGEAVASTYRDVLKTPGDANEDVRELYNKLLGNEGVLSQEDREEAKQLLMTRLGIPEADADRVLSNWQNAYEGSVRQLNSAVSQLQSDLSSLAAEATKPAREAMREVVSKREQRQATRIISNTASDIYQRPSSAGGELQLMLDKLFAQNGVFGADDREQLIAMLEEETGIEREEIERVVENWEERYQYAANQVADAVDYAENTAIEAAQTTTDVAASTAGWAAFSLILAAFAACIGGLLGRPEDWMFMRNQIRDLPASVRRP